MLVYHPDKAQHKSADGKKEDRSVFLKVQEAFNVLSNETKRERERERERESDREKERGRQRERKRA